MKASEWDDVAIKFAQMKERVRGISATAWLNALEREAQPLIESGTQEQRAAVAAVFANHREKLTGEQRPYRNAAGKSGPLLRLAPRLPDDASVLP